MNINFNPFGSMIAGLYFKTMSDLVRDCQTVLQSCSIILYFTSKKWEFISKYFNFKKYKLIKPVKIESKYELFNKKHKVAGTLYQELHMTKNLTYV